MFEIIEDTISFARYAIDKETGIAIHYTSTMGAFKVHNPENKTTQTIVAKSLYHAIDMVNHIDFTKEYFLSATNGANRGRGPGRLARTRLPPREGPTGNFAAPRLPGCNLVHLRLREPRTREGWDGWPGTCS